MKNTVYRDVIDLTKLYSKPVSIDAMENAILRKAGIDKKDFYNNIHTRRRYYLYPRQAMMYYAKMTTDLTWEEIGLRYGKDHSTVIHAVEQVENYIETKFDQFNKFTETLMNESFSVKIRLKIEYLQSKIK